MDVTWEIVEVALANKKASRTIQVEVELSCAQWTGLEKLEMCDVWLCVGRTDLPSELGTADNAR